MKPRHAVAWGTKGLRQERLTRHTPFHRLSKYDPDKYVLLPHLRMNLAELALRDGRVLRHSCRQTASCIPAPTSTLLPGKFKVEVQSGLAAETPRCTSIARSQITCSSALGMRGCQRLSSSCSTAYRRWNRPVVDLSSTSCNQSYC